MSTSTLDDFYACAIMNTAVDNFEVVGDDRSANGYLAEHAPDK